MGNFPEALIWLKQNMDEDVAANIISDHNHSETLINSIINNLAEKLTLAFTSWNRCSVRRHLTRFLHRFFHVANCYLDFILDISLLTIIFMVKGPYHLFKYDSFTSQLTFVLVMSIMLPHLKSALTTAHLYPVVPMGYKLWLRSQWKLFSRPQLFLTKVAVITLYPLMPALVLNNTKEIEGKRIKLEKKVIEQSNRQDTILLLEEIKLQTLYLEEARHTLLIFKRNELFMEIMIQLPIHILMLMLSETDYPLESGLQAVFKQSDHFKVGTLLLLVFSIIWSLKTVTITYLKIKTNKKQSLDFRAKAVLALRATLVFCVRMVCYLAYFAPYVGLGGLMNHFKAEKTSMNYEKLKSLKGLYFQYWNKDKDELESIKITDLYRSDYREDLANPTPPPLTSYTAMSLQVAYFVLICMGFLYGCLLWLVKICSSYDFKRCTIWEKLQHIVEVLNIPETFCEWDSKPTNQRNYVKRWWSNVAEMMCLIFLQFISNMTLLIPLLLTGNISEHIFQDLTACNCAFFPGHKIIERHETIRPSIGYFPEEQQAYLLAKKVMFALPVTVTLAAWIDCVLVLSYMKWIHPWCGILQNQKPSPDTRATATNNEITPNERDESTHF